MFELTMGGVYKRGVSILGKNQIALIRGVMT
jgi:hypothetical protein